ncbi:carbonate dehydratase [Mucilaginibacter sp. cycad4]|uniref:carbonate dehydratase n=1 Tax=Mucilaginibacter sp. cycad4 TaxID=3342096 RepID=UPI002AAAD726|nr:carbonate dehydratase [Mucilaginibacter gossypii]WPV00038.1 carbonate dehydratase [Mucilaginibacter gossypii]
MCAQIHDTSHITYEGLLEGNKKFIEGALAEDPQYFDKLANGQKPPILWIGCADSRVPANQITNTAPGEIFVHRNIANMVIHSDMNMLSVLDYAVNVLKVKHVIVTGHYGCGGVNAAMSNTQFGLIDNWLRHIKDVYRLHADELDAIENETERSNRLVELNVIENVYNLCKTSIVQNAWAQGQELAVHGWVYSLSTGLINDMKVSTYDNANMDNVFKFK